MQCKERLEAYLREHQVPFQVQQHARTFSAQKIAESEHIPGKMVAKTVIAWADNQMLALVLPASYRADLGKVGDLLGAQEIHYNRTFERKGKHPPSQPVERLSS